MKKKIAVTLLIILALACAYWYGGSSDGAHGWTVSRESDSITEDTADDTFAGVSEDLPDNTPSDESSATPEYGGLYAASDDFADKVSAADSAYTENNLSDNMPSDNVSDNPSGDSLSSEETGDSVDGSNDVKKPTGQKDRNEKKKPKDKTKDNKASKATPKVTDNAPTNTAQTDVYTSDLDEGHAQTAGDSEGEPSAATKMPAKAPSAATKTPAKAPSAATKTPAKAPSAATKTPAKAPSAATNTPTKVPADNTCTITISCADILSHLKDLTKGKEEIIPEGGIILGSTEVDIYDGDTVFDILKRVAKDNSVHLEYSYTPVYGSYYIEGIANIYENDCGDTSGWTYYVNGEFPGIGVSSYEVSKGDFIKFWYSCEY